MCLQFLCTGVLNRFGESFFFVARANLTPDPVRLMVKITSQPMSINLRCYESNGNYKKIISQLIYFLSYLQYFPPLFNTFSRISPLILLSFEISSLNFYFRTTSRGLVTEALNWQDKPSPRRRPWRRWLPEVSRRRWRTRSPSPSASTLAGRYPHQSSWFRLDPSINQSIIIVILMGVSLFMRNM